MAPGGTAASAQEEAGGLRLLGKLEPPSAVHNPITAGSGRIIAVDAEARLLYYKYVDSKRRDDTILREYDLRTPVPKYLREGVAIPSTVISPQADISPKNVTIDSKRKRMYVLHARLCVPCPGEPPSPSRVEIVDLRTLTRIGGFDLSTVAPGAQLYGLTYSPEDDRIYFVGDVMPVPTLGVKWLNPEGAIPATVTVAMALDPENGALAWIRPIPDCVIPLANRFLNMLIVRSRHHPALYFGCIRPWIYPGESGVVRLWITPDAGTLEAQQFRTELFPISGSYTHVDGVAGNAFFDYETDRFFLQSIALTTPGTWVFDGRISAWVGFIAAPSNDNYFLGMNEGTGRFYMGGQGSTEELGGKGYVVAADGRSAPVPQGRVFGLSGQLQTEIFTDARSKRLFLRIDPADANVVASDWFVYEDTANIPEPEQPTDFDAVTSDLPEGPNTASSFAGNIKGFGARAALVGGIGGIRSFCSGTLNSALCAVFQTEANPVLLSLRHQVEAVRDLSIDFSPADRGVHVARVSSLDVRNVGVSTSATAVEPDSVTSDEYVTKIRDPSAERAETLTGNPQTGEDAKQMLTWPYGTATCLDAGGKPPPDRNEGPGGDATAACDLAASEANASTHFMPFSVAGVSVGASSFSARGHRDPVLGTVTEATAIVKGIELAPPGAGSVTIGEIVAQARTVAHGRPGTASAEWTRRISNVVVRNASGEVTFQCGDADSCDPRVATEAINRVLGVRMRVYLPDADTPSTPKGAFAGVQKSDAEFLNSSTVNNDYSREVPAMEIIVLNDNIEKSRLLIQLAAIQASSIYGISPLPGDSGFPPSGPGLLPDLSPLPPLSPPSLGPPITGTGTAPRGPGAKLVSAALFLIRSPKDAFLVGLIGLLFVGAGTLVSRRRTLLRQLGAGS